MTLENISIKKKRVAGEISYNGFHVGGFNPFENKTLVKLDQIGWSPQVGV